MPPGLPIRIPTPAERAFEKLREIHVTPEGDQLFMAPETVAVVLRKLPAESREARFAVGFAQPESAAEPPDVGNQSLRGPDKTRD